MQLVRVRVTNFRSIEDSEEFELPRVACLVGKNESGKTALLQAIYRLNPVQASDGYDLIRDYPRRKLSDYEPSHAASPAQILETSWELSDDDIAALEEVIGTDARKNRKLQISAFYPAKKTGRPSQTWGVAVSERAAVEHVLATAKLFDEEKRELAHVQSIADLKAALANPATERHTAARAMLDEHYKRGKATLAAIDCLDSRMPVFVYFSQYEALRGRLHLETLKQKKANNETLFAHERLFLDLCEFAGTTLDELASINSFETLKARFEAAQNKITDQIFEYWSTNQNLSVEFSRDPGQAGDPAPFNAGTVFNIRIKNELHGNTVPFDERSSGFVWFFSFLVLFDRVRQRYGKNVILLLDEPGLNLHAKAQADLLQYIDDKLKPGHQVIYTTHSPFMVPHDNLLAVRTVEDVIKQRQGKKPEVLGTKVRSDVLEVSGDTLFPIQGALGFEITQTLFVGKHTLIVEGPSDLLYLKAYSETLRSQRRPFLDPRWTICPVGGIDKVPAFMALFGQRLSLAVLLDLGKGGKNKVAEARKLAEKLRTKGRVFTYADFTGKPESDVEDMIGDAGYVALVSGAYGLAPAIVAPAASTGRVLEYVTQEMRVRPSAPDFDHYHPAEHLLLNRSTALQQLPGSVDALDRFAALFEAIGKLLS